MFAGAATDHSWANVAYINSARRALVCHLPEQVKRNKCSCLLQESLQMTCKLRWSVVAKVAKLSEETIFDKTGLCTYVDTRTH